MYFEIFELLKRSKKWLVLHHETRGYIIEISTIYDCGKEVN